MYIFIIIKKIKAMKRLIILSFTLVVTAMPLFSQITEAEKELKNHAKDTIEGWKTGGMIAVTFSQVSLTNWAAGGQNSISLNGLANIYANYFKGNTSWENRFDVGYGILKQGKEGNWMKTDDKLELMSKYGRKATKHWFYSAFLSFKSQMTPGYNYPDDSTKISNFLAPAYVLGAIGMDYKPSENFSAFIAPFTSKITIVNDKELSAIGAFGVDTGQTMRIEFGGYARFFYKKDFSQNITLQTKLDLFSNYFHNPQNIDINWETLIAVKVSKWITMNLATTLLYDDDIKVPVDRNNDGIIDGEGVRTQFKEVLGVGFSYKF
jgi:hypothetical protein